MLKMCLQPKYLHFLPIEKVFILFAITLSLLQTDKNYTVKPAKGQRILISLFKHAVKWLCLDQETGRFSRMLGEVLI